MAFGHLFVVTWLLVSYNGYSDIHYMCAIYDVKPFCVVHTCSIKLNMYNHNMHG